MRWLRRLGAAALLTALAAALLVLAQPNPAPARANVPCDVGAGPVGAVTGAIGLGNPVGDACNEVSGALEGVTGKVGGAISAPVTGALKGLGDDVFRQLTSWVAEGAGWLMGQVVKAIDTSTTPRLDTEGFLRAYARMAAIAAVMACAMLLLAILEGIAQGSPALLARVVAVNVPLAFLGTSLAFAVVQLLIGVTDGLSAAIAGASHHDSTRFFEAAIGDLGHIGGDVGGSAGAPGSPSAAVGKASGSVAVPLFVGFVAAIVGAFAAFAVWLELVMRDAAVYAVALFMPLALAASIWPRWTGALRRTGELLVAVIGSKFVIVAIVSLAASLIAEEAGSVEHVLAAAALMCLACFAPFVLLRLIPFSEGALAAAYGRRSATGGAIGAAQIGSDVAILRNIGRSREGSGVSLWSAAEGGGTPGPGRPGGGGPGEGSGGARQTAGRAGASGVGPDAAAGGGGAAGAGGGEGAAAAAGAGGPGAVVASVPVAAERGAKGAAGRLSQTAAAQQGEGGEPEREERRAAPEGPSSPPQPRPEPSSRTEADEARGSSRAAGERPPRPSPEAPRAPGGEEGGGET